ncbi:MAG: hypothetical protein R3C15_19600 [Thermoleophilia bacterium]
MQDLRRQANGIREQQPRCSALTRAGDPGQSFALRDTPYRQAHAGTDMAALGSKGWADGGEQPDGA